MRTIYQGHGLMWPGIFFLCSLIFHEASHLLASKILLGEGLRILVKPGGFHASWKSFQPEKYLQCIICAAGPAANFLAAVILLPLPVNEGIRNGLIKANLLLGFFNLLPLYPMDGGSLLLILLYNRVGSTRAYQGMRRIGYWIRAALLVGGLYTLIVNKNPSLFVTIVFLPGIQSIKRSVSRLNLNALIRRRERILRKKAYPVRHILILKEMSLGDAMLLLEYDQFHLIHIADVNLQILLQISEQQLVDALLTEHSGKTLEEVFLAKQ